MTVKLDSLLTWACLGQWQTVAWHACNTASPEATGARSCRAKGVQAGHRPGSCRCMCVRCTRSSIAHCVSRQTMRFGHPTAVCSAEVYPACKFWIGEFGVLSCGFPLTHQDCLGFQPSQQYVQQSIQQRRQLASCLHCRRPSQSCITRSFMAGYYVRVAVIKQGQVDTSPAGCIFSIIQKLTVFTQYSSFWLLSLHNSDYKY